MNKSVKRSICLALGVLTAFSVVACKKKSKDPTEEKQQVYDTETRPLTEQVGCPNRQIFSVGRDPLHVTGDTEAPALPDPQRHVVPQGQGLHHRPDPVVATLQPSGDIQVKIDLGAGALGICHRGFLRFSVALFSFTIPHKSLFCKRFGEILFIIC